MKKSLFIVFTLCCLACNNPSEGVTVSITNTLNSNRNFETVEINTSDLAVLNSNSYKVLDTETGKEIISQSIDFDKDGKLDILLFQPEIAANTSKSYTIIGLTSEEISDSTLMRCYSRFVPERTDDYAWENNRVAFRTYGPTAQKMKEDGVKGGTLSSGMDAWLKRVDYPIINKWYKKHTSGQGSYHEDSGEGLDNFHVGVSRGVGGTAVRTDSSYAVSKNFISYQTITNGPIRTAFTLQYDTYDANGKSVKETKSISLDYGQNLSRHKVRVDGTEELTAGLTLHNKDGVTTTNTAGGWMSYWEPYFDSELGQGIVVTKKNTLVDFDKYETEIKDKSNLYVHLRTDDKIIDYYAGFGWKKSGQFQTKDDWNNYLSRFSKCLDNPLEVKVITSSK